MNFRRLLVFVCLSACSSGVVGGCGKTDSPTAATVDASPKGPRVLRIDQAVIERLGLKIELAGSQSDIHQIQVPGSLDFDVEKVAQIGTVLDGRITSVFVKVGDQVKKGQKVATLIAPAVGPAQADFLAARAESTFAADHLKREEGLAAKDLTTAQELALARSQKLKGDAQLAAAEARLRAIRVPIPSNGESLANAGLITLTSPIDGIVMEREVVVGQFLHPQETALVVADLSVLWAKLDLFEGDLPYLRLGADATLSLDALPGKTYTGKVAAIEPHVGKLSRTVRARVLVPNPDGSLRPGYFVRASIQAPEQPNILLIPSSAVQPLDDGDVVFIEREKGHYEVRQVNLARRTAQIAEVSEGLARGERIVVQGAFLLRGELNRQ